MKKSPMRKYRKKTNTLNKKRAELLKPVLENFFHGALNTEEEHRVVMEQYKEFLGDIASRLRLIPVATIYYGTMLKRIYEGSSRKLAKIMKKAEKKT